MRKFKILGVVVLMLLGFSYGCSGNDGEDIIEIIEENPEQPETPTTPGNAPPTSNIIKINSSAQFLSELARVEAGDTLQLSAGTYSFTSRIILDKSGTFAKPIVVLSDTNGEIPVLDFSSMI